MACRVPLVRAGGGRRQCLATPMRPLRGTPTPHVRIPPRHKVKGFAARTARTRHCGPGGASTTTRHPGPDAMPKRSAKLAWFSATAILPTLLT